MTWRLTSSSLAGTSRNEVAVGTAEAGLHVGRRSGRRRHGSARPAAARPAGALAGGCADGGGRASGGAARASGGGWAVARRPSRHRCRGGPALGRLGPGPGSRRRTPASSRDTEEGSARYCSYISSTSHALGPRGSGGCSSATNPDATARRRQRPGHLGPGPRRPPVAVATGPSSRTCDAAAVGVRVDSPPC